MPLADAILAVLTLGACHGNRLAAEIGMRAGRPVNAGQVAKTLGRLAAAGLVESRPRDAQGRIPYVLTAAGGRVAAEWLAGLAVDEARLRLVASLPAVDRDDLLAAQVAAMEEILATAPPATGLSAPPRRGRPARQA